MVKFVTYFEYKNWQSFSTISHSWQMFYFFIDNLIAFNKVKLMSKSISMQHKNINHTQ